MSVQRSVQRIAGFRVPRGWQFCEGDDEDASFIGLHLNEAWNESLWVERHPQYGWCASLPENTFVSTKDCFEWRLRARTLNDACRQALQRYLRALAVKITRTRRLIARYTAVLLEGSYTPRCLAIARDLLDDDAFVEGAYGTVFDYLSAMLETRFYAEKMLRRLRRSAGNFTVQLPNFPHPIAFANWCASPVRRSIPRNAHGRRRTEEQKA
jgi:hypothetical protein